MNPHNNSKNQWNGIDTERTHDYNLTNTKAWQETVAPFSVYIKKAESHHAKKIYWMIFVHYAHENEEKK